MDRLQQGFRYGGRLMVAGLAALAMGCRGERPAAAAAATVGAGAAAAVPASASAPATLAVGTPAGGLPDWIADVRRGLAAVPSLAARDPARAQQEALDLYLTRQEYIEMYWGEGGRLTRGPALAPAIEEAENRFHILLAALAPRFATPADTLRRQIAGLNEQYARVLAAAAAVHVPMDAHGVLAAAPAAARPVETGGPAR